MFDHNSTQSERAAMLTRKELAHRWNVCQETIKRRERSGVLPFILMGPRLKRYWLSDVLRIEAQMHVSERAVMPRQCNG
jgi:hypothetical protein